MSKNFTVQPNKRDAISAIFGIGERTKLRPAPRIRRPEVLLLYVITLLVVTSAAFVHFGIINRPVCETDILVIPISSLVAGFAWGTAILIAHLLMSIIQQLLKVLLSPAFGADVLIDQDGLELSYQGGAATFLPKEAARNIIATKHSYYINFVTEQKHRVSVPVPNDKIKKEELIKLLQDAD